MHLYRPKFWKTINIFSIILIPFSILYFFIIFFKKIISNKSRKVTPVVICIGNATVGGSGKTPICMNLGMFLKSQGFNIAYLTRGFGGNRSYIGKVDNKIHSSIDVGDEAVMLSMIAPTYVGKNRFSIAELAELDGADVIIMDDGMQNSSLYKDITVLAFDYDYMFGNRFLLPAGPLREPLSCAFKKATFLACTNANIDNDYSNIETNGQKIFSLEYSIKNFDEVRNNKFVALSSIADPEKFIRTAKKGGAEILESISYPDHHNYTELEIKEAVRTAQRHGCKILTTSKDIVKIPKNYLHNIVVLDIHLKDHNNLNDAILNTISTMLNKK